MYRRLIFPIMLMMALLVGVLSMPQVADARPYCPCVCDIHVGGVCGRDCGSYCDLAPYGAPRRLHSYRGGYAVRSSGFGVRGGYSGRVYKRERWTVREERYKLQHYPDGTSRCIWGRCP